MESCGSYMQGEVWMAFILVHFFLRSGRWESYGQSEQFTITLF